MISKYKLGAYTILEVTVVMILSAVCISIIYTAFSIINGSFIQFNQRNKQLSEIVLTDHLLRKDFFSSEQVRRSEKTLLFKLDSGVISYAFEEGFILRDQFSIRTDTLRLDVEGWDTRFEGREIPDETLLDELNLSVWAEGERIKLSYIKRYSSADLFNERTQPDPFIFIP